MIYLLDVNALIALVHRESTFHDRVAKWIGTLTADRDELGFCAISELGVVRILPQLPESDWTVDEAKKLLAGLKAALKLPHRFVADSSGVDQLPRWVKNARHTTDGHLIALAKSNDAVLATLDQKIPGAFIIPKE